MSGHIGDDGVDRICSTAQHDSSASEKQVDRWAGRMFVVTIFCVITLAVSVLGQNRSSFFVQSHYVAKDMAERESIIPTVVAELSESTQSPIDVVTSPPPPTESMSTLPAVATAAPPSDSASCITSVFPKLNIMCLGDSITFGNGSHMPKVRPEPGGNYPLVLKRLLEQRICTPAATSSSNAVSIDVFNLGMNGRTASAGPNDFAATKNYKVALTFAPHAHLAIVMLGTNDTRESLWKDLATFITGLKKIIDALLQRNPKLRILLCSPPPVAPDIAQAKPGVARSMGAYGVRPEQIRQVIRPNVAIIARELHVEYIDMYAEVEQRLPDVVLAGARMEEGTSTAADIALVKTYLHDGLHPKIALHDIIAEILAVHVLRNVAAGA